MKRYATHLLVKRFFQEYYRNITKIFKKKIRVDCVFAALPYAAEDVFPWRAASVSTRYVNEQ